MAKTRTIFFCTECGNEAARWQGQCPACSAWNTLVEEPDAPRSKKTRSSSQRASAAPAAARLSDLTTAAQPRWPTGLDELDFVLGGGVVPGSLILIGGEPGIGKSTLLLQVAARLATSGSSAGQAMAGMGLALTVVSFIQLACRRGFCI